MSHLTLEQQKAIAIAQARQRQAATSPVAPAVVPELPRGDPGIAAGEGKSDIRPGI